MNNNSFLSTHDAISIDLNDNRCGAISFLSPPLLFIPMSNSAHKIIPHFFPCRSFFAGVPLPGSASYFLVQLSQGSLSIDWLIVSFCGARTADRIRPGVFPFQRSDMLHRERIVGKTLARTACNPNTCYLIDANPNFILLSPTEYFYLVFHPYSISTWRLSGSHVKVNWRRWI